MPKNKFKALSLIVIETKRQLADNEISVTEAEIIFNKLLADYNNIKKSLNNDDFNNFFEKVFK